VTGLVAERVSDAEESAPVVGDVVEVLVVYPVVVAAAVVVVVVVVAAKTFVAADVVVWTEKG
jgi:hypothetical protein